MGGWWFGIIFAKFQTIFLFKTFANEAGEIQICIKGLRILMKINAIRDLIE